MDQYAVNALWQMSDVEAGTHATSASLIDPILTTLRIDEGEACTNGYLFYPGNLPSYSPLQFRNDAYKA